MDRRTLLKTGVWVAPAIVSAQAGVAWADHYRRPSEDEGDGEGDIVVGEICPPIC